MQLRVAEQHVATLGLLGRTLQPGDIRDDSGPFDIVGDVHGCVDELVALLDRLGYRVRREAACGRPRYAVAADGAAGRRIVLCGDLVDRGPASGEGFWPGLWIWPWPEWRWSCPETTTDKLCRALARREVERKHGLAGTLE